MKKILLLNILFLISSMTYGYTMYSTSSYLHSRNTNVAYTQTYNTYNNTGVYRTPRIGYTTQQYANVYQPFSNSINAGDKNIINSNHGQPRRASSVSSGEVDGVRWEIIAHINIFGEVGYYEIWIDGKYYDWYVIKHNAINAAIAEATRIANERAHASPIGDPIIPTTLLLLSYIGYKTLKRKRK